MTRVLLEMPTPVGIGAGQTASVTLPLGLTYERLLISMNVDVATVATDVPVDDWGTYIDDIRLIVDGETRIQIKAADLVSLNKYYGYSMVAGVLPLFLSQPNSRTPDGEDSTAYGTRGGMSSFAMEMDLKTGITINSLTVSAMQSPGRPFGRHLRIQRHVVNQGTIGEAQISDLPRGPWALRALHVTTGAIGKAEVLIDNKTVYEAKPLVRAAQAAIAGKTPQAGFTHVDMLNQNRVYDAMPMAVQDFRLKADFEDTGTFSIYAETIRGA